jgi:TonB family protein
MKQSTFIVSNSRAIFPGRHAMKSLTLALALVFATALVLPSTARAEDDRRVLVHVKPVYPELAKRLKIAGTVVLNATVAPNGSVRAVQTIMGEGALIEAAKEAVSKWRYEPADRQTIEDVEITFP